MTYRCLSCGRQFGEPADDLEAIGLSVEEQENVRLHCPRCGSALTQLVCDDREEAA